MRVDFLAKLLAIFLLSTHGRQSFFGHVHLREIEKTLATDRDHSIRKRQEDRRRDLTQGTSPEQSCRRSTRRRHRVVRLAKGWCVRDGSDHMTHHNHHDSTTAAAWRICQLQQAPARQPGGMDEHWLERRAGCKRARRTAAISIAMRAVLVVLMVAPHVPSSEALKLASISEDGGHLGVGLLRAVEVVRGRYERAWALVSTSEPTAEDLDTALELLQENAKQWESLEPAVKLWTERDNEGPQHSKSSQSKNRSSTGAADGSGQQQQQQQAEPGASDTTYRIYEEAASLLAHNRAVLGQALARSGHIDRGIEELEVACPEIVEYQQNAQGRRDSESWLHCYAHLTEMYKTQKRFEEASSLLARMPWLPSPQGKMATAAEDVPSSESPPGDGDDILAAPLGTGHANDRGSPEDGSADGGLAGEEASLKRSPRGEGEDNTTSGASGAAATDAPETPPSKGSGGGRSDAPLPRGAGAARVAGLNKAAAAASAAAAAESAAAAAAAVETGAEAAARAVVERHAEAMRASMNEIVGELAVTTATRPSASQDWLNSRVLAAEEVLSSVRFGSLAVASPEQAAGSEDTAADAVEDVPAMVVGATAHADILREASHYLSGIKGVASQGWAYVDNELHRMERYPAQPVKPGFQSRREVIHTFRYLLMKARQYASENQSQSTRAGTSSSTGSGSPWRRKERGRKASSSSKAAREGSASRGKSSTRSGSGSSSDQSDGIFMLLVGAGIALLLTAFSSGRTGGQGRRREVVRQRTATRAAKTVGSYIEPPQRTAIAALLLHLWGNLKRSSLMVSSRATTTASLARTVLFTAWASVFERVRAAAKDFTRPRRAIAAGKAATAPLKKSTQRSKKNAKKTSAAPAPLLVRGDTTTVTPPASPPALAQSAMPQKFAPAAPPSHAFTPSMGSASTSVAVEADFEPDAPEPAAPEPTKTVTPSGGASNISVSRRDSADASGPIPTTESATVQTATEKTAGVPFPDVMTAEQVQAMVEEDERAWEQARLSERLHSQADAAASCAAVAAAASTMSQRAADKAVEDAADAGWSEVGSSGSRGRTNGGGRGRVLSIRNVRAAAQAARTSSPGSDPATTTSASSSDSGEGCKDKPSHRHLVESRSAGRMTGRQDSRTAQGTTRVPAVSMLGDVTPAQSRGATARPQQRQSRGPAQARGAPPEAISRPVRASHAPWATARNAATTAGGGKPRNLSEGALKCASTDVDTSSSTKGSPLSEARPPRQSLQRETCGNDGAGTRMDVKKDSKAPSARPAAWTNTPSHPLGMHPEPPPLPPASEMPRPPPQHQQHWQRQQQREQQRQQQQQKHHFFHQQEAPLMPMTAAPVHPHQDVNHHYPRLSRPLQPHRHPAPPPPPQQQQQEVVVVMPQFITPSEGALPPASVHMPTTAPPVVLYPAHLPHVTTLPSPGVSPGGELAGGDRHFLVRDGSNDSAAGAAVGFSPDAPVLAPPQAMVLAPPYEQQQPGRFSPPTLQVIPVEDVGGGVGSPMYGHQQPGHGSPGAGYALSANPNGGGSDAGEAFENLMGALRWQVEYYFSAENLVTDAYLRGLMDPQGFVAVSKIIVFNRVRSMTSDYSLLIEAMRRSSELEIMEQDHTGETRVRTRHSPLHWTQEQVPPPKLLSTIPLEPEEEDAKFEEQEHHITFGNVEEVIGQEEHPPLSVGPERAESQE